MKHGIRTFVFIECKMPCLKLGEDPVEEIKTGRATILQVISEEKLSLLFKEIQNLNNVNLKIDYDTIQSQTRRRTSSIHQRV